MKKYIIPSIKLTSFQCESVLTTSGVQQEYIQEATALQRILGEDPEKCQSKMVAFSELLSFN